MKIYQEDGEKGEIGGQNLRSTGVSVLIKNTFVSQLVDESSFVNDDFEVSTVETKINNLKFTFVGVYRTNDGNWEIFMTYLQYVFFFLFISNHR